MKIEAVFDQEWYYADGGIHVAKVRKFARECEKAFQNGTLKENSTLNEVTLTYSGTQGVQEVLQAIRKAGETCLGDAAVFARVCKITVDGAPQDTAAPREAPPAAPAAPAAKPAAEVDDMAARIAAELRRAAGSGSTSPASEPPKQSRDPAPPQGERTPEPPKEGSRPQDAPAAPAKTQDKPGDKPSAMERIEQKVASWDFKELCRELTKRAPAVLKNQTQQQFFREVYLFSVNTGGGYTSSLELLGELMQEIGLFTDARSIVRFVLPDHSAPDYKDKMNQFRNNLENAMEYQRIISLDISGWTGSTDLPDFKDLLMHIFQKNDKCLITFRVGFMAAKPLEHIRQDISDIISARCVVYEPFTCEELRELARRNLDGHGFALDENAWNVFNQVIEGEKKDGSFYGIHTVEKITGQFIRCAELNGLFTSDGQKAMITVDMLDSLQPTAPSDDKIKDPLEKLDSLIGMEHVSAQVREILNQILFARTHNMSSKPAMHMCFVGNPGTGKTTVARLIGEAMRNLGVLRVGKFFEVKGRDLCGQYVGQTAPKTTAICQRAYGSVLFIDEAYSLVASDSGHDYGQEAVDTLIAEMENHSDDLIVIFAGYPKDMDRLLDANAGMRSRVPYTISFPSYDREQLLKIFMKMSTEYFTCEEGFEETARKFFESIPDAVLQSLSFGNARFARNIYERVWSKAVLRCGSESMESIVLTSADFELAAKEFSMEDAAPTTRKIGFSM